MSRYLKHQRRLTREALERLIGDEESDAATALSRRAKRDVASSAPRFESAVRVAIEEALRATRGKIYGSDGAASRLGLKPGTLQSKMRKLGIERSNFV